MQLEIRLATAWKRVSSRAVLFPLMAAVFLLGLMIPYLVSSGLPITYDLPGHYHLAYRMSQGLWDGTWSAGVPTFAYPPTGELIGAVLTGILGGGYDAFKTAFFAFFLTSVASVYILSRTVTGSHDKSVASLAFFSTSPALLLAFFAGWLTVLVALTFLTLGYALFHRFRTGRSKRVGFLSGLFFALAITSHPYGLIISSLIIIISIGCDSIRKWFSARGAPSLVPSWKDYSSVVLGVALGGPALIPFLTFVEAVGSQTPSPHVSRTGTLLGNVMIDILDPLGPFLVLLITAALIWGTAYLRSHRLNRKLWMSGLIPYGILVLIVSWLATAQQGGLATLLPFANWLVYDVFVLLVLPFVCLFASMFAYLVVRNHPFSIGTPRRWAIALVLMALVAIPYGAYQETHLPAVLGASYGSTYDLPTSLSEYLNHRVSMGEWGRLLALGVSGNIFDLPDIQDIGLINNGYATSRLLSFLRSSGIDDFNNAKYFANGTQQIRYVLSNYEYYGIKWILVGDHYYDQFIPQGAFEPTSFLYRDNNPSIDTRLYEAAVRMTPFDGDIKATYRDLVALPLQSTGVAAYGSGASNPSIENSLAGGILLSIQTNRTWGWAFFSIPIVNTSLSGGATLLLEVRSSNSSYMSGTLLTRSLTSAKFASNMTISTQWSWMKFNLSNVTSLSSILIGVAGSRIQESLELRQALIGYPAIRVISGTNGLVLQRDLTAPANITLKYSYFSLMKSDTAKIYKSGDFIGLTIPQGVTTVSVYLDPSLFAFQYWYSQSLLVGVLAYAAVIYAKGAPGRRRSISRLVHCLRPFLTRMRSRIGE